MKHIFALTIFISLLLVFMGTSFFNADNYSQDESGINEVAITFDDLPAVSTRHDSVSQRELTEKLLEKIKANDVPAVGFVNEGKLYDGVEYNRERAGLLNLWLQNGLELGNHTYSHHSLNNTPLEEYENDVIKGESTIARLMSEHKMKLRYFRHPFLHTGRSLGVRDSFITFLSGRGYTVAPVTIDNSDWIFARAYDNARDKADTIMMNRIAGAYIPYMESKFEYYENQSLSLFGRNIKQVLLLHANTINSEHFGELAEMIKKRGYKIVSLEEALKDSAYRSPDTYIKAGGISWLHRWAITKGFGKDFFKGEPLTPEFVMKQAGVSEE